MPGSLDYKGPERPPRPLGDYLFLKILEKGAPIRGIRVENGKALNAFARHTLPGPALLAGVRRLEKLRDPLG
jgi:hypothetical protein